jgi:antitoxin component of MazEF toxin-antitoxin module
MPLIQKIIQIGDSKAVTIPKSWLVFYERQSGQSIKEVSIEVNGALIIRPITTTLNPYQENSTKNSSHAGS